MPYCGRFRGVDVTILLEEGILDSNSVGESQKGHANVLHNAGANVLWMVDPTGMSSPYTYIHSKIALRDDTGSMGLIWQHEGFKPPSRRRFRE